MGCEDLISTSASRIRDDPETCVCERGSGPVSLSDGNKLAAHALNKLSAPSQRKVNK